MNIKFKISGLDCANCAASLERELNDVEGVLNATVNFMTQKINIEIDENNEAEMVKKITKVIKSEEPDATIERL